MEFVMVTGMSGAGKSLAIKTLEDSGFYCVDNLPIELLPKFADMCKDNERLNKVGIVADIRAGDEINKVDEIVKKINQKNNIEIKILFLDCDDETIIKRYKETRRIHPLDSNKSIFDAIKYERKQLEPIKKAATVILDTSRLSAMELKRQIEQNFLQGNGELFVKLISFGFKHGILLEADMVFDVRCIPNPYYIPQLKEFSGLDDCVYDYVFSFAEAKDYKNMIVEMLHKQIPYFIKEGKNTLIVGLGCTGGRHRSVAFARAIENDLNDLGHRSIQIHRDINIGSNKL